MPKRASPATDDDSTEIPLQRPYVRLTLGVALTAALAAYMFHRADTNVRGLIINGIIHLDPGQADVFYAVMGLACLAFTALVILSLYNVASSKRFRLKIGAALRFPTFPLWKARREVAVPIDEVVGVELQPPQKPRHLIVVAREGRFALPVSWLPDGWSPDQVAEAIVTRARAASARSAKHP